MTIFGLWNGGKTHHFRKHPDAVVFSLPMRIHKAWWPIRVGIDHGYLLASRAFPRSPSFFRPFLRGEITPLKNLDRGVWTAPPYDFLHQLRYLWSTGWQYLFQATPKHPETNRFIYHDCVLGATPNNYHVFFTLGRWFCFLCFTVIDFWFLRRFWNSRIFPIPNHSLDVCIKPCKLWD